MHLQGCAAAALLGVHFLLKAVAAIQSAIANQVRANCPLTTWQAHFVIIHQGSPLKVLHAAEIVGSRDGNRSLADLAVLVQPLSRAI